MIVPACGVLIWYQCQPRGPGSVAWTAPSVNENASPRAPPAATAAAEA